MKWTEKQIAFQTFLATPLDKREALFGTKHETVFAEQTLEVTRQAAYKWKKLPGWVEEINQIAIGSQQGRLGDLYEAIFDQAIDKRDTKAMRLAAELGINMLNKQIIQTDANVEDLKLKTEEEIKEDLKKLLSTGEWKKRKAKKEEIEAAAEADDRY